MEPLKEMFNKDFYTQFAHVFSQQYKPFDSKRFLAAVTKDIGSMELNQRLRNTSIALRHYLPQDYKKAIDIMFRAAPSLKRGYTALVLPDFVGLYGKNDVDLSLDALKFFTTFGSSEFAVREFIKQDAAGTLKVMQRWAEDENVHVRRLASEGSRPRLPWSFRLEAVIKKPEITAPILERLKADDELYVKKSVANHLNDIAKDHPDYMIALIRSWDHSNAHTKWIVKHASRNLLKQGHKDSLSIFSFEKNVKININNLQTDKRTLKIGDEIRFSFELESLKSTMQKLVVDYAIQYARPSGAFSRKIFKLKELEIGPKQKINFYKKQAFKDLSTRKHYKGHHIIEILVNGKVTASCGITISG